MSGSQFIPKIDHRTREIGLDDALLNDDKFGAVLLSISQYFVIMLVGIVPVFFIPGLWASLGFDKTIFSLIMCCIIVVSCSLHSLRKVNVKTITPLSLVVFWLFVFFAFLSGLLSGDIQDAMRGSVMETQTVGFLVVLALSMSVPLILQGSKIMTIRAMSFFGLAAILILLYNLIRIFFGADILSFASFNETTISPIGGFNDLALFAALMVILSLITLVQLPLKLWIQSLLAMIIIISLALLSVVNFFNVWIVIGFFGLLMLVYILTRDTLFKNVVKQDGPHNNMLLVVSTVIVCVVSALFVIAGNYFGEKIATVINTNYVEVRPSPSATVDIASDVYSNNILLGIGPNRFADAWRLHKDQSINETIFWDTDFNAGSGYIPTLFVTIGLIGGSLVILFHLCFLYLGYKMLLRSPKQDQYWYFFGVSSFAVASFIWGMSYIYVPGTAILLIGSLFTGFSFVAASSLLPSTKRTIPIIVNRSRGFFFMMITILIVVISVASIFSVGRQYIAQSQFTKAEATTPSVDVFKQIALSSYDLYEDDKFTSAIAQKELIKLTSLLNIKEPSEEDQRKFLSTSEQALLFAEQAVSLDPTNPDNHAVLSGVYMNLALAGISGARERAIEALSQAQQLDPFNPGYKLISAQMSSRIGDSVAARKEINEALSLKENFSQALYLLAQLDINEGNIDAAITTTRSIISLEPRNQTRYFQLGLLLSAKSSFQEAVLAYQSAVGIDPKYANARYLLAITYLDLNQKELALEQLKKVKETNQDNLKLNSLIEQIESGEIKTTSGISREALVGDLLPQEGFEYTVITDNDVETKLVSPVNVITDTPKKTEFFENVSTSTPVDELVTEADIVE